MKIKKGTKTERRDNHPAITFISPLPASTEPLYIFRYSFSHSLPSSTIHNYRLVTLAETRRYRLFAALRAVRNSLHLDRLHGNNVPVGCDSLIDAAV